MFDISCKLSLKETICVKCQTLFSKKEWEKKRKYSKMQSAATLIYIQQVKGWKSRFTHAFMQFEPDLHCRLQSWKVKALIKLLGCPSWSGTSLRGKGNTNNLKDTLFKYWAFPFKAYRILPNYHTMHLGFSKLLEKIVAKYPPNKRTLTRKISRGLHEEHI